MNNLGLKNIGDCVYEIPRRGSMRVPGRIYANDKMLRHILSDNAPEQVMNVACLPGIVNASLAMPDIHWGYGFPIGGVAAFDMDEGVISPGGVGYDVNCGVRLLTSSLLRKDIAASIHDIATRLFQSIPSGVGSSGALKVGKKDLNRACRQGAAWAVAAGYGDEDDLRHIEENGCMEGADPDAVSERAVQRGLPQLGTLGSGNHFLEVGHVSKIYDEQAADTYGLFPDQVTVMIHCGSRGYGHQICDDYLSLMDKAVRKYRIQLPDRQLACTPVRSEEGKQYLSAMRCAVNFAFANRQIIAHQVREAIGKALGRGPRDVGLRTLYEVAHNIAKIEAHVVDGKEKRLCVHRKGATRAFAPGRPEIPDDYRPIGQPVLIPGDMGRYSYVLKGSDKAMQETFGSTCHGAGRAMSRKKAKSVAGGRDIAAALAQEGILVMAQNCRTLAEEMSDAYKDVSEVVDVCEKAGISHKVAQLRPLACIKG